MTSVAFDLDRVQCTLPHEQVQSSGLRARRRWGILGGRLRDLISQRIDHESIERLFVGWRYRRCPVAVLAVSEALARHLLRLARDLGRVVAMLEHEHAGVAL